MTEKDSKYVNPEQTRGRPSAYTDELANMLCEIIKTHHQSDEILCGMYSFFPEYRTFCEWKSVHPHFSLQYERAKEIQLEVVIDNVQKELDDEQKDFAEYNNRLYSNNGRSNRLRCKVGFVQWRAACLKPEKYGVKKSDTVVNVLTPELMSQARELLTKNHDAQSCATTDTESAD